LGQVPTICSSVPSSQDRSEEPEAECVDGCIGGPQPARPSSHGEGGDIDRRQFQVDEERSTGDSSKPERSYHR